jgi:hypothetical protein
VCVCVRVGRADERSAGTERKRKIRRDWERKGDERAGDNLGPPRLAAPAAAAASCRRRRQWRRRRRRRSLRRTRKKPIRGHLVSGNLTLGRAEWKYNKSPTWRHLLGLAVGGKPAAAARRPASQPPAAASREVEPAGCGGGVAQAALVSPSLFLLLFDFSLASSQSGTHHTHLQTAGRLRQVGQESAGRPAITTTTTTATATTTAARQRQQRQLQTSAPVPVALQLNGGFLYHLIMQLHRQSKTVP